MVTVAIFNAVVVALALLAGAVRSKRWLRVPFVLIFLFLAVRYDFGNDYREYLRAFRDMRDGDSGFESGWQLLCLAFQPLGFFAMVATLAAFQSWVYYRFVARYVPAAYYGFALFLFVFDPYLMLVGASSMRQALAISLFVLAIEYLETKRAIRYFVCIGLGVAVHTSALILVPLFALAWVRDRVSRGVAIALFVGYLAALTLADQGKPYFDEVVSRYATRYEVYQGGAELGTGFGVVYGVLVLAAVLFAATRVDGDKGVLLRLAVVGYFATVPLALANAMASRVGLYFSPVYLAALPLVSMSMRSRRVGALLLASYVGVTLYSFYKFFHSEVWRDAYAQYQTILSAPGWY